MAARESARWLAERINSAEALAKSAIKATSLPQLANSSIEAGQIDEYDAEGTLVGVTGEQFDGTHTSSTLVGPLPPEPSPPAVTTGAGLLEVRWAGKFAGDEVSPMDFSHVSVHVSDLAAFEPDNETQRATITGETGDVATIMVEPGEWTVLLVAVSKAGKWSSPSETVTVQLGEPLDAEEVKDTLNAIDDELIAQAQAITAVQITVDGLNRIYNAETDPAEPSTEVPFADGDKWQKWSTLAAGGKLLQSWRFTAGAWVEESMDPTYLPKIDIGQGTFGLLSGQRLVVGSIAANLLEAQLILSTDIIAGNPDGTHVVISPTGIRVMASTDGGAPTEVVRLGTDTNDYFGIAGSDGQLVASITSMGDFSGQNLDISGGITVAGTSLLETVDAKSAGLLGWASRYTDGKYWAGATKHPYLSLQVDGFRAGRAYMIRTTPINMRSDAANSNAAVYLHVGPGTRAATVDDPVVAYGLSVQQPWTTGDRSPVTFNRLLTPSSDGTISFLLSYGIVGSSGRCRVIASTINQVMLSVEDLGPAMDQVGEWRDGSSDAPAGGSGGGETTPPVVVKTYDKTYSATGIRSFLGNGAHYNYNPQYMYSGPQPYTANGDLSSMAVFPSFTGDLSGATVTGVWVYVYYDFWYQGSGGTAYIGLHGQSALSGSAPAKTYSHATAPNWPRAAGRWIKLSTSTYAGFKSGLHRGITLGGSGGGYERYGYARSPKIRITFTK